jgi:MFS family permease
MTNPSRSGLDSPQAWIVASAAFGCAFVAIGISYCFGVFLKPMEVEFHTGHAAMSAVFSIIMFFSFFLAPLTGRLADRYGPRPVVAAGAVLMAAGLVATAHVHYFPLVFVTYGLGLGSAIGCAYIPTVAAVGAWFNVHRIAALGVAASGIGCGTLVAAPLSARLIERYGWRTTFDIFGWGGGAFLALFAVFLARPPAAAEKTKVAVASRLRTPAFAFLYISLLFVGIAVYISLVFLPAYATDLGASRVAGASLLGYIGASSVLGRLGLNALASRFGLFAMYIASYAILLASFSLWLVAHQYPWLVAFSWVMGVGYGGIAAMAPAVAASFFGVGGLGELLGILFTGLGVASLIGPPAAGALVDYTHDFKWPIFLAAPAAALAIAFVIPLSRYGPGRKTDA